MGRQVVPTSAGRDGTRTTGGAGFQRCRNEDQWRRGAEQGGCGKSRQMKTAARTSCSRHPIQTRPFSGGGGIGSVRKTSFSLAERGEHREMKTEQKIGGGKCDVEMQVCGSGEPLLYLHGAGGLLGVDPFLEDLGKDFKVVAPHLPGYGTSTGGELIEDVFDACLFYHQLMDDLGIASAHVVGHSMGGMLAAELAALDVHRIKKLVLVSPAGFWLEQHPIPDPFAMGLPDLAAHLF